MSSRRGHFVCRDAGRSQEASMDRNLVSRQQHELQHFARKYGVTVERFEEIMKQTVSRSRKKFEAELSKNSSTSFFEKSE
jgi:hypothetical protein